MPASSRSLTSWLPMVLVGAVMRIIDASFRWIVECWVTTTSVVTRIRAAPTRRPTAVAWVKASRVPSIRRARRVGSRARSACCSAAAIEPRIAAPGAPGRSRSGSGRRSAKRAPKIELTTATPSAEPSSRVVPLRPEATPACVGGSACTISPDSGGIANPIPALTTTSAAAYSAYRVSAVASDTSSSPSATAAIPSTIVASAPIRSTSRVLRALANGIATATGSTQTPVSSAE